MKNVAIFPCGSEVGLEIHNALKFERTIELHGLSSVACHGQTIFRNYDCTIPWIKDPAFFDRLNAYILANDIEILFPAYDDVVEFLAENRDKLHCVLAAPSAEVCAIARSKARTYATLAACDFVPKTYDSPAQITDWPAFAKPDRGQGSQGILRLDGPATLIGRDFTGYVLTEYLPGEEYTVDCFSDRENTLRLCQPRERLRTKSGISVRTQAVAATAEILRIGAEIQAAIPFRGAWFFQVKRAANGQMKLLEVAPRVGGSMGLTRNLGANLPLLTVWDLLDHPVTVTADPDSRVVDRYFGNRYAEVPPFKELYIDYDDTITCHGQINTAAMGLIYNCRNRGLKVVLITRFAGDLGLELSRRGIAVSLFDTILHITDGSAKSGHISGEMPIFIDDSFAERLEVRTSLGIPTYAVDANRKAF